MTYGSAISHETSQNLGQHMQEFSDRSLRNEPFSLEDGRVERVPGRVSG